MGLLTGQAIGQGDFITTSAGAGDSGKVPKLNASGVLDRTFISGTMTFQSTAGTTLSVTTVAGQQIMVFARGRNSGSAGNGTASLKYNGVTKDSVAITSQATPTPYTLFYTEVPGAGTHDITLETDVGSINNPMIMVIKF